MDQLPSPRKQIYSTNILIITSILVPSGPLLHKLGVETLELGGQRRLEVIGVKQGSGVKQLQMLHLLNKYLFEMWSVAKPFHVVLHICYLIESPMMASQPLATDLLRKHTHRGVESFRLLM